MNFLIWVLSTRKGWKKLAIWFPTFHRSNQCWTNHEMLVQDFFLEPQRRPLPVRGRDLTWPQREPDLHHPASQLPQVNNSTGFYVFYKKIFFSLRTFFRWVGGNKWLSDEKTGFLMSIFFLPPIHQKSSPVILKIIHLCNSDI